MRKKQDKAKVCAKLIPCGEALVSSFSVLHTVLLMVRNHQHDNLDKNVQIGNFVTFIPKAHNQV